MEFTMNHWWALVAVFAFLGGIQLGRWLQKKLIDKRLDSEAIEFAKPGDTYETPEGDRFVLDHEGIWIPESDPPSETGED